MKNNFTYKKSLGQNFLINEKIANRIVDLLPLENENIIEIGCGDGMLTKKIITRNPKKLIVIEIDQRCIENVQKKLQNDRVIFIQKDALDLNISDFDFDKKPIIISNLPYSVGTRIYVNLLKQKPFINQMTLMFQKEVGKRIVAQKSTEEYGLLSVVSQIFTHSKIEFNVNAGNFFPVPKVDSVVMSFIPNEYNIPNETFEMLLNCSKSFFSKRRKILRSQLKNPEMIAIFGQKRIEELTPSEILKLVLIEISLLPIN